MVSLGLIFFWIGMQFFRPICPLDRNAHADDLTLQQLKKGFKVAALVCGFVQTFLLWKFASILIQDPALLTRQLLFGTANQDSVLFNSKELALLYFVFVQAALRVAVITGFAITFFTGRYKYLAIGNLLCLVDSLLFLGRGALLEFAFQLVFFLLVSHELRRQVSNRVKRIIGVSLAILFLSGAIVGVIRGDTKSVSMSNFIKNQVINYHTVGFVILDQELADKQSRLNQNTTYGLATLGGIERLTVLLIRRFDKSIDTVSGQNGEYLAEFRVLGRNSEGEDLYYNAFATIFYTFFLDGGYLFVLIGMAVFGMWISRERTLFLYGRASHLTTLYTLVQAGYSSLFFSPVESTTFWMVIIALYLIRKLSPAPCIPHNVHA